MKSPFVGWGLVFAKNTEIIPENNVLLTQPKAGVNVIAPAGREWSPPKAAVLPLS